MREYLRIVCEFDVIGRDLMFVIIWYFRKIDFVSLL